MHNIAILSYNNIALFELGCATELFALPRPELEHWYNSEIIAFDAGPHNSTGGICIQSKQINNLDAYDTLVIPSWPIHISKVKGVFADEVKRFHAQGKRILTFCSGAFLLASLGILDKRKATTHWKYAANFKKHYPEVNYVGDVLYVYDGQIGCSAGSAAALDLGLEVIRQDFGIEAANHIARSLLVSSHRKGGQSQFEEKRIVQSPSAFSKTIEWASKNLQQAISINTLAERTNMSRRSFDRKFREHFNSTPKRWLTDQRLIRAKTLLATEQSNMEQIASKCGFENAMTMRYHFHKILNMSPRQYRDQFAIN